MKNIFIVLTLTLFAVACSKSSGGGSAPTTPGTYQPGTPGSPGEPKIEFDVSMSICSRGALNVSPGTKMSVSAAREYFYDYLRNADRMRADIGHGVITEYDRYSGQAYERDLGPVDGYDLANGRYGQNSGYGQ